MTDDAQEEKKILIDEDWKSQVQAEKEALREQEEDTTKESPPSAGQPHSADVPPASLTVLYSTLATQAMVHLGQIPNPVTGKGEVQLELAGHFIDMLRVLEEKTEGNRTPEETTMLTNLLHELRMVYVSAQSASPPSAGAETEGSGP